MEEIPVVYSDAVGKCEHKDCGKIIDMDQMPISMSTAWKCPHCGKEISREKTFGYERGTIFWRKVSWIDKNGNWTKTRPKREFIIGGYYVANKVSSLFLFIKLDINNLLFYNADNDRKGQALKNRDQRIPKCNAT